MHALCRTLLLIAITALGFAFAADQAPRPPTDRTPPRVSLIEGSASFLRPGAEDWTRAWVNTPLAAGDALYTAERTTLEIQVGARAFVRAAEKTHVALVNLEPDFLQIELKAGTATLDLRSLPAAYTVELDTPNAVFTIEHPGYYRAEVAGDSTHFITRRGGRASVAMDDRPALTVASSEEIVVRGTTSPALEAYVAPELDAWDRWNYARTEYEIEALSKRYVSPGVYGAAELDRHGTWRIVPPYGPVWVPYGTSAGWVPYSTGSWIWDPYYGWTWLDDAPWGWAPFHYGRWVYLAGVWAWAPGPVIARPLYAPALVAFFRPGRGISLSIGITEPAIAWVALGWGEPLHPWWGRPGFVGVPWWGGWGGPRVGHPGEIVHHNTRVPRATVAVEERRFGRGPAQPTRFTMTESLRREMPLVQGQVPVKPGAASLGPGRERAPQPPAAVVSRPSVATRPSPRTAPPFEGAERPAQKAAPARTAPRTIAPPKRQPDASAALPRAPFGDQGRERTRPTPPPRAPQQGSAPAPRAPREAGKSPPARSLPGRPADQAAPRPPARAADQAVPRPPARSADSAGTRAPGRAGGAPERPGRAPDR